MCELDHKDIQEMLLIANEVAEHARLGEWVGWLSTFVLQLMG